MISRRSIKTAILSKREWAVFAGLSVLILTAFAVYFSRRVHTGFSARIWTKSISFRLAHTTDSDGIFNSGDRVNVTIQVPCEVRSDEPKLSKRVDVPLRLENVQMQSLGMSEGLLTTMDVFGDSLHYILTRSNPTSDAFVVVRLDGKSKVPDGSSLGIGSEGELSILPVGGRELELSVNFLGQTPNPETNIPLAEGTWISFEREGKSEIVESPNNSLVLSPNRSIPIRGGLRISGLQDATIEKLSLNLGEGPKDGDSIAVAVSGKSNDIRVGPDKVQTADSQLDQLRLAVWTNRFKSLAAVIGAFGALAAAISKGISKFKELSGHGKHKEEHRA